MFGLSSVSKALVGGNARNTTWLSTTASTTTRPWTKLAVEDCLTLSTADLASCCVLDPGCRSGLWRWGEGQGAPTMEYECSVNRAGYAYLTLRYSTQGESHSYCVSLVSTVLPSRGRRWWFKCPLKDVRVANLYLPPGAIRFASRQAHNLTYRSCQESGRLTRRVRRMASTYC